MSYESPPTSQGQGHESTYAQILAEAMNVAVTINGEKREADVESRMSRLVRAPG